MNDQELLMLSGIQHFAFCPRQWALIHIEQLWADNTRTVDGQIFHKRAHEATHELRVDNLIVRGLRVSSQLLGITGVCDVVEFHRDGSGVPIQSYEGRWLPYPVEYKKGKAKENDADRLQLCAQAICLEEMLFCKIPEGALFYGETRHREVVCMTDELRQKTAAMVKLMHQYEEKGYTPPPHLRKECNACSLKELCIPRIEKAQSVQNYINRALEDMI